MKYFVRRAGIVAIALVPAFAVSAQQLATSGRIAFPAAYDKGVMYGTVDRADLKQFREMYAPQSALDAAKKGMPMPDGTVLTMLNFKAKLGPDGNPVKDAKGRLVKDELAGYVVMEKRKGWGKDVPEAFRNGDWEYQAFKTDKTVNAAANIKGCFECHKPLEKHDYLFSWEKMGGPKKM
jgi:hypothetical protein